MHHDVLESERVPEIVFHLERVEGELVLAGTSDLVLVGTVSLHGEEHELSFPASVRCDGPRLAGTAHVAIPFVSWGLEDPSFFLFRVDKEVQVELEVEGSVTDAGPTGAVAGSEGTVGAP
jgi:hypothetical protein